MTGPDRERELVELVDPTGVAIGQSTVDEAHQPPGWLHRAFSVILIDPGRRLLLQQRAAVKTRFPLRWANACCGHPPPGVPLVESAGKRLAEELGITDIPLSEVGVHLYQASDPTTGRVEYEYDHVLVGAVPSTLDLGPDPDEVADLRWVDRAELERAMVDTPETYAPWLPGVVALLSIG